MRKNTAVPRVVDYRTNTYYQDDDGQFARLA